VNVTPGEHTFTVTAVDRARNTARQTVTYSVEKPPPGDTLGPSITITSPAPGRTYFVGESVLADYGCSDEPGGSGIASCDGPVRPGGVVSTATPGSFDFTVTARDRAGNTTQRRVQYSVATPPSPG
jgi:hypothetical protein